MSTTTSPPRRSAAGRNGGTTRPRTGGRSVRPGVATPRPRPRPVAATRSAPVTRAPRAPFVLLVIGLLGGGLVSLLLLNTVLAEDAFALDALRQRTAALEERQQALRQEVARAEAPEALAHKARALGMVPAQGSGFVDIGRGKVVGQPSAAPTSSPTTQSVGQPRAADQRSASSTKPSTASTPPATAEGAR